MAKLSVTAIRKAGLANITASLVAAEAGGDSIDNASGVFIAMQNGDASAHTLTVAPPVASKQVGNLGALDVDPISLVVAAGDIGFLAIPQGYIDSNGDLSWTYDSETSVNIGAFSIAP